MFAIDGILKKVFHRNVDLALTILDQQVQLIVAQDTAVSVDVFNCHQCSCTARCHSTIHTKPFHSVFLRIPRLASGFANVYLVPRRATFMAFKSATMPTQPGHPSMDRCNEFQRWLWPLLVKKQQVLHNSRPCCQDCWPAVILAVWHSGNVNIVGRFNKVTLCQARLALGWVTIFGRANHLSISSSHPCQLSLLHSAGREMGISQTAVTICGWAVKAGIAHSTCG